MLRTYVCIKQQLDSYVISLDLHLYRGEKSFSPSGHQRWQIKKYSVGNQTVRCE